MEKPREEKQVFRCTGDCLQCSPVQRQYCSSQLAYNNLKVLERLEERLDVLSEQLESMDMEEAPLINPIRDHAQEGDGAKTIDAPKN